MTEDELQDLLEKSTPARERYNLFVEECQDQEVRLRFSAPKDDDELREGGWSIAALLALVDTSLRAAAGGEATLTHLNVTMIRPPQETDVFALSRAIRRDGDTVHAETWLFCHAVVEPMLHATASLRTEL